MLRLLTPKGWLVVLAVLAVWLAPPSSSQGAARRIEINFFCPILEVRPATTTGRPDTLRIGRGRVHGLVAKSRGEIYGRTKDGGVYVVGRAEVVEVGEREAVARILPEPSTRYEAIDAKGAQLQLRALLPADVHRGLLFELYLNGIVFLDNARAPLIDTPQLLAARDEALERTALDKMIVAGHEVIEFTDDLKQVVTHGRWKGKVCKQILTDAAADDYRAFLRFVRDYPGKYIGHEWKISETFATWIINDMPLAVGDRVEELGALPPGPQLTKAVRALEEKELILVAERLRGQCTELALDPASQSLKLLERIVAAVEQPSNKVWAELWQARARVLDKQSGHGRDSAAAYRQAAELYALLDPAVMRDAPLEQMICINNEASEYNGMGRPDEALSRIQEVHRLAATFATRSQDPEILAHAQLSDAFAVALGARIANERGDYRRVIAELVPILDRYGAVGAAGFRDKEIELLRFVAKAYKRLGDIDQAAEQLRRASARAAELDDPIRLVELAWDIGDLHYDTSRYEEALADYQRTAMLAEGAGLGAWQAKALAAAAQTLWSMGRAEEAVARHAEGLAIRERTGDTDGIAWQLTQVGKIRRELGDREEARGAFEKALALYQKRESKRDVAEVERELGNLFLAVSEADQAEPHLQHARSGFAALKMAPDEGWTAIALARAQGIRRDHAAALGLTEEAIAIGDRTGDRSLRVYGRMNRGRSLRLLGRRDEAQKTLDDALAAAAADPAQRGDVLVERANVHQSEGRLEQADQDAAQALALATQARDVSRRIAALSAQASVRHQQGRYEEALAQYQQVVKLAEDSKNRPALVDGLQQTAWQLGKLGRLSEARQAAERALGVAERNGDLVQRGWSLNTLAEVASFYQDVRQELAHYEAGIALMHKAGFDYGEAALVFNRALVRVRLRDLDQALADTDAALRLAGHGTTVELEVALYTARGLILGLLKRYDEADASLRNGLTKAETMLPERVPDLLSTRGRFLGERGDFAHALPLLEQAAALSEKRSRAQYGARAELGIARAKAGEIQAAERDLREVLDRAERAGGALPWEALYHLGKIEARTGREEQSIATLVRAAKEIEHGEVVLKDDVAKARYWSDKAGVYVLLVKLLLGKNRIDQALGYVERAKAAELEELRRQAGRDDDIGLELEIAESRFDQELTLEAKKPSPDRKKMERLDELLGDVRRRRADYIDQIDRKAAESSGGGRDVYALRPLELEKLQQHVPPGMLVLSPLLLDDHLVVFAITHETLTHFETPVAAGEIEQLVAAVLAQVVPPGTARRGGNGARSLAGQRQGQSPGAGQGQPPAKAAEAAMAAWLARVMGPAERLYDLLLRAALERFGTPKVLVISPAGSLRYLPFTALHDGQKWLIERTAVLEVTSLDQQKFAEVGGAAARQPNILALADPDGSLPGARQEVAKVRGIFQNARVLDGQAATLQALREQIRTPGYEIVHLATHGLLDAEHPEQSQILLAGQSLYYKDIPTLRFARTQLVVLSACDTAARGSGAEVTGLAYQFERTHVRGVLATLWPVDDEATAELMTEFYRGLRSGSSYIEALAAAQRRLAGQPSFKHPYFWAPFILVGAP